MYTKCCLLPSWHRSHIRYCLFFYCRSLSLLYYICDRLNLCICQFNTFHRDYDTFILETAVKQYIVPYNNRRKVLVFPFNYFSQSWMLSWKIWAQNSSSSLMKFQVLTKAANKHVRLLHYLIIYKPFNIALGIVQMKMCNAWRWQRNAAMMHKAKRVEALGDFERRERNHWWTVKFIKWCFRELSSLYVRRQHSSGCRMKYWRCDLHHCPKFT